MSGWSVGSRPATISCVQSTSRRKRQISRVAAASRPNASTTRSRRFQSPFSSDWTSRYNAYPAGRPSSSKSARLSGPAPGGRRDGSSRSLRFSHHVLERERNPGVLVSPCRTSEGTSSPPPRARRGVPAHCEAECLHEARPRYAGAESRGSATRGRSRSGHRSSPRRPRAPRTARRARGCRRSARASSAT